MKRMLAALIVLTGAADSVRADRQVQAPSAPLQLTEAEQRFAEQLSGVALVGTYTVDGQKNDQPLKAERYEISKVSKLRDDYWVFNARIKYGDVDATVPLTLKVLWAGDTPVLSLTDLTIPGVGTFTARVLFYGDRYVGTWQHGKVGGHMFGKIEKLAAQPGEPKAEQN